MAMPEGTSRRSPRAEFRRLTIGMPQKAIQAMLEGTDRTVDAARKALTRTAPVRITAGTVNVAPEPIHQSPVKTLTPDASVSNKVTLEMFNTDDRAVLAPLMRHYVGRDIDVVAALSDPAIREQYETRRKRRYLRFHPDVTPEQYDTLRDEEIRKQEDERNIRINRHVFSRVQQELGRGTMESAAVVYEAQRQHANATVREITGQVFPGDTRAKQRNEVDLKQRPDELVNMYFSVNKPSDEILQREIQRQAILTAISLKIEQGKKGGAEDKLTQLQNLLDEKLYAGPQGATTHKEFFGVFHNGTNAIAVDADGKPQISYTAPADAAPEGTHYKRFVYPMRELKGTGEFVLTEIGEKERPSSEIKAIHKAYKRARKGESDDIRADDVEDTHRMMLVVDGDDAAAYRILTRIFDIVTDDMNQLSLVNRDFLGQPITNDAKELTGQVIDVVPEDGTKEGNGDSKKVGNYRIKIYFDGLATPIEIIVKPLYKYLYSEYEVGKFDPTTNKYSGVGHDIYKNARATEIADITHSHADYPDLVRPNVPNDDGTYPEHPGLEKTVAGLRKEATWELAA